MRIKKAAEAKHEATKSPATTEFLNRALGRSLLDLLNALREFPRPWSEPRGDLYHWLPLLNAFDLVLGEFNSTYNLHKGPQTQPFSNKLLLSGVQDQDLHINLAGAGNAGSLDSADNDEALISLILDFGRMLLDNCANRTLYNSSEHIEPLLNSTSQLIVASALHLASRCAATYYRSNHHRPNQRQGLNPGLLQIHYRINTDYVQKLAEPFSAQIQRTSESNSSQPQTPSGVIKEAEQGFSKKSQKQSHKIHPNDLSSFISEYEDTASLFSEFKGVNFDINPGSDKPASSVNTDAQGQQSQDAPVPTTPTPLRRTSFPSRLSRATASEDVTNNEASLEKEKTPGSAMRRMLVVSPQEVEDTDLTTLMRTYMPRMPNEELSYAFLTKTRFAKSMLEGLASRQMSVNIRLLALINVAYLYPEPMFVQKVVQQDSQLPREFQIVYQLAEIIKPGERKLAQHIRCHALEALEAISTKHKSKQSDVCNALGINVNHGVIFQLLQEINHDLRQEDELDAATLDKHERVFNLLESLLNMNLTSRTGRSQTMDTLVSAGLFGALVEILNSRSSKAQHAQNRTILLIHEGSRQARDGVRIFANASGLDALAELIAWEVSTCLDAVASGNGVPTKLRSKVMDYSVPIWHRQTLRTALKFVNQLLSQQTIHVERLLRNLIDSPTLLKAMNQIITNASIFGSNIYANTISMVSTFIHNEPQSYSVIQEAGISRALLDSITSPRGSQDFTEPSLRRLPIRKTPREGEVLCGRDNDVELIDLPRSSDTELAANILCSTDVLLNLPHSFGALCLTAQGLQLFLSSRALESYFEVFESEPHVRTIASEKDLATFIGNAFDELVRHHPDLKTAVLRCFILTLARLVNKCQAMKPARNTELNPKNDSAEGDSVQTSAASEGDIHMSGTTENVDGIDELLNNNQNEEISAATYVSIFCRFLNGFFANQQMAASFLDNGGLPFALDMCTIPNLPYNFVCDPGYDDSFDLTKTIHMLSEARPSQTIPVVLAQTQSALDKVLSIIEGGKGDVLFKKVVLDESFDSDYSQEVTHYFTHCLVYLSVCQELLGHYVFPNAHERTWSPLTAINATEMWVDLIVQAGKLSQFCVWEAVSLFDKIPDALESATRIRANGIGFEANRILGVAISAMDVKVERSGDDFLVSVASAPGSNDHESGNEALPQTRIRKRALFNVRIIRHLLVSVPNIVSSLFLNIGGKAVTKRMVDYTRQNMFMIVEAVAKSSIEHLRFQHPQEADSSGHQDAYYIVILEMMRKILNVHDVDSGPSSHFMTIFLLGFRNNGVVILLNEILHRSWSLALENLAVEEKPPKASDDLIDKVNCARTVMHLILILYSCISSSKFIVDSSQSSALAGGSGSKDLTSQFSFSPSQSLVEIRASILPAIESMWSAAGAEGLASSTLRRIIRIFRPILEADNENRGYKRRSDIPVKQKAKHKQFSMKSGALKQLRTESSTADHRWSNDIIVEALYRSNNDVEMARDYAEARYKLSYPRFPPPQYDIDVASTVVNEPLSQGDSQSLLSSHDLEADSAPRVVANIEVGENAALRESREQPDLASQVNQTVTSETDDDGRMAMSIDNVLNITERERSEPSRPTSSAHKPIEDTKPSLLSRKDPPIDIAMNTDIMAIEDLDNLRNPLRSQLITRVLDVLSVHENLTVDLAELLRTAASKARDSEQAQQIKATFAEDIISVLLSFGFSGDIRAVKGNVSACANLLARLMQDKWFYQACSSKLLDDDAMDTLLSFVKTSPEKSPDEGHPWIGHVLLIFEKLLSEELQPQQIEWHAPRDDDQAENFSGAFPGYVDQVLNNDHRDKLFESIVTILPQIGKDQSLALSAVRVLAMLTRHQTIADKLADRQNLQKLFIMIKQMAGVNIEGIQSSFMLILRHISEDESTVRRTMRNAIVESFANGYRGGEMNSQDTTHFIRTHHASILREPKIFLEVTNEVLEIPKFEPESRTQTLALRSNTIPKTYTAWESSGPQAKTTESPDGKPSGSMEIVQSTETGENTTMVIDKARAEVKAPIVERPDGLIHFLLSQLLSYKTVEDKENDTSKMATAEHKNASVKSSATSGSSDTENNGRDSTSAASHLRKDTHSSKTEKKEAWKAEDHPIYHFRCFLLQCLTELLTSYNHAKVEFINFSRKADPKAMTPSKPRSGVLNYLLNDLIPLDHLTRETSIAACKKQGTSTWAMSVVVALCMRTPETYRDSRDPTVEARDNDLLFVRKFVIEHAVRAYRDIQTSQGLSPEVRYARLLSVSDLFNRILMGRVLPVPSSMAKQTGETEPRSEMYKTQVARIMYEKNLISVLTASCSEIDLNVPNAKRAIKYILRPLKSLTFTAIEFSKESDSSSTLGQSTEEDDISTATSVSDLSDAREETPDLFRHSALGMLDANRGERDESGESEDDDEEMYGDEYDEGMEYDDDMDQVDDDEAVSDPDDSEDDQMGPIEGRNGDMIMDIEVVNSDEEGSDDEDESDEDESDEDEDETDDDDADEDMDGDLLQGEVEIYEEVEEGDGVSLNDPHEHEWRDIDEDDLDDEDGDGSGELLDQTRNIDDSGDLATGDLFSGLVGSGPNFSALNDDIESGRYMADMELIQDEEDENGDEDEDDLDDDDADEEDAFMYETYDDEDEDGIGWGMDEAFELFTGRPPRHHHHHHHHHPHAHEHHGGLRGAPFGRAGDLTFMTSDNRPSMIGASNPVRVHRNGNSGPRGTDEGINPLLARNADDHGGGEGSWSQRTGSRAYHHRGMPSLMHAVLGGPVDRGSGFVGGLGGLMNAVPDILARHGGWAGGGNITINAAIPEDIEFLMGGGLDPRSLRYDTNAGATTQRSTTNAREDLAQPPSFTPMTTGARWQEEAKLLFPNSYLDLAPHVTNSVLKILVPESLEKQKERKREEDRKREEERQKEEKERIEKEKQKEEERREKEEKERQERVQREREEEERRQREAEQAILQPRAEEDDGEAMEIDLAGAQQAQRQVEQPSEQGDTAGEAEQTRPRVMTRLRDREVDITDLGIDADYIEALPEELREEVVMSALQEQRAQTAETGQVPAELNQEFLNALPEELREEIVQQDQSDRRRRERQEARRREQESSGAARAEEMDTGSFLATLDDDLRRSVLLEENIGEDVLNNLPPALRREAEDLMNAMNRRHREAAPSFRYGLPDRRHTQSQWLRDPESTAQIRKDRRPVVQMLDKQGIATVLRLLFIPQQGSLKESLNTILENLAQNRQNRAELISLLLALLQDGSSDNSAIERSYASLSYRAKQRDGAQMTPKQLKRSLTDSGVGSFSMSSEVTPTLVLTQCLAALGHLSQFNPHVQGFFVNEHETSSTLRKKGKGKEKDRDAKAQKFALNALLCLLDKKMIMDNAGCMEHLSSLLQHVTQPLTILARREREEREREAKEKKEKEEEDKAKTDAATGANDQVLDSTTSQPGQEHGTDPQQPTTEDDHASGALKEGSAVESDGSKKADGKKQRNLVPPVVPEHNLQLVVNIITAKECNSKIFRDTMSIITNLSAIPGAKDVFGRELVKQAQTLGSTLASELAELLNQLQKEVNSSAVQTSVLSKFSSASSDQTKLLRVLTALDYLFDPKRANLAHASNGRSRAAEEKSEILSSLYDNPTFAPVWSELSDCLRLIREKENVTNVATILLPLIEALMVVCKNTSLKDVSATLSKSQQFTVTSPEPESAMDTLFFRFTEEHRKILNDLVRNNPRLMSGSFSLLVENPKVLEFDNKRNYFTRRLHTRDDARRSQPSLQLNIRRNEILRDSFRALFYKRPEEMKYGKLNIKFSGEDGVDAGGVSREWFQAISRQMFDPSYALFVPVASDRTTFHPNKLSYINEEHLAYFKFVGRIIGKAMYEGRPLDCHFSRAVYKRILGRSVSLKDMETLDLDYYKSLLWMLGNDITDVITETFSVDNEAFGVIQVVDLIPDGRNIPVTEENKHEFVQKVVEYRLTGSVNEQLEDFLTGFHDIVPASLISIFNEQELELLISGLPEIDIDDWKANTEYHNYNQGSAQIQWFWRAVRSFDKEERAKLLQFVTGTSKVPLNGFEELEGMNGFSKFNIHRDYGDKERLPSSHTCFNQLDLPEYDDYETLRARLYTAMTAGGEYFGFA